MARASFLQSSFLGGIWSATAQGRMHDPAWKTALNVCLNAFPMEAGAWTRRQGFHYLQHTKGGAAAVLRAFEWDISTPYIIEFTDSFLRLFQGTELVTCNDGDVYVDTITQDTPAKVVLASAMPSHWANDDTVMFTLVNDPCGNQAILCNRQFTIANVDSDAGTYTLKDPISGEDIDGSTIAYEQGASLDKVAKIFELATPYTADELAALRIVSDNANVLILHKVHEPHLLSAGTDPQPFAIATQDFSDGPWLDINDTDTTFTLSDITGSVTVTASAVTGINDDAGFKTTDVGRLIRFQGGPQQWDSATDYHKGDQVTGSDGNIYVAQGGLTGVDPTMDDGTHWVVSSAKVNWVALKITARTDTTHVTATLESDLRDDGTFSVVEGQNNIRAKVQHGDTVRCSMESELSQIDFTTMFSTGQTVNVTNGAFTDGSGGDISGSYEVFGVFNDAGDNRSILYFDTLANLGGDWDTVDGLTDHRTAYYSPKIGTSLVGDYSASTAWRLGAYSDTDGWPQCGTYHEGRLWLSGYASNRVDSSKSNDHFNFSPTDTDGTVAEDNAIAAIANATDLNQFFWMESGEYGLYLGSLAGEWIVRASATDDPIAPDNIQMRRVTNYGCANVEPQLCTRTLAFVQRQSRRIMDFANYPWGEAAGWYAENLAEKTDSLTGPGIAEIRYQQTPLWCLWHRLNDGTLTGNIYRHAAYGKESFNGWHQHEHGDGRTFESLANSPAPGGLSDTLYAVTNQTDSDDGDHNVRWVEMLSPLFDAAADDCDAFFVDGAIYPCCVTLTGGSPPTGIRIYGLWHLNGKSVLAHLGGLDVGHYTVASGYIDIAFTTDFSWTYFQTLTACDNGVNAYLQTTTTNTPAHAGSLMGVNGSGDVDYDAVGGASLFVDHDGDTIYEISNDSDTSGIMKIEGEPPGNETLGAQQGTVLGTGVTLSTPCFHPSGYIFGNIGSSNFRQIVRIRTSDLTLQETYGTSASSGSTTTGKIPLSVQMIGVRANGKGWLASVGSGGLSGDHEVDILFDNNGALILANFFDIDEKNAALCPGFEKEAGQFIAIGRDDDTGSGDLGFYEYRLVSAGPASYPGDTAANAVSNSYVTRRKIGTIAVTDVDATWSTWTVEDPGYDRADGNIVIRVRTADAVTNKHYLLKIGIDDATIVWSVALPDLAKVIDAGLLLPQCRMNGTLCYMVSDVSLGHYVRTVSLSDGTSSTAAWNNGFVQPTQQIFDYATGTITGGMQYTQSTGPVPTYLGDYLANNSDAIPANRFGRIYTGAAYTTESATAYPMYGAVGMDYNSDGQLLRPDFGQDAGAQLGPAFGKPRRIHKAALALVRTQNIKIGTTFDQSGAKKMYPVALKTDGGTNISAPTLFTGVVALKDGEINDNHDKDSMIAWRVSGGYPGTVTAISGAIQTQDE